MSEQEGIPQEGTPLHGGAAVTAGVVNFVAKTSKSANTQMTLSQQSVQNGLQWV